MEPARRVSGDPTGEASAWTVTQLESPLDFRGVSCPTTTFCAAVGNEGSIAVSTNPAGPASAWSVVGQPGGATSLNGISCPSPALCVTGNAGQMISSTNPTSGAGEWHVVSAGSGLPVKGISCPLPSACAAVDNNADVLTSTDPTGVAWDFVNVIPPPPSPEGGPNGMFAISCQGTSFCLAAGQHEQVIFTTDPFTPNSIEPRRSYGLRVIITHHPPKRISPHRHGVRAVFRFHAVGGRAARYVWMLNGLGVRHLGRRVRGRGTAHPSAKTAPGASGQHRGSTRFAPCSSVAHYRVGNGSHVFRVRAIAADGGKSPSTAFRFSVDRLRETEPPASCHPFANPIGLYRACIKS